MNTIFWKGMPSQNIACIFFGYDIRGRGAIVLLDPVCIRLNR